MCVPQTSSAIAAMRFSKVVNSGRYLQAALAVGDNGHGKFGTRGYHGNEYVFTFVKLFIASCTPSLYPRPESLIPPKGVSSSR